MKKKQHTTLTIIERETNTTHNNTLTIMKEKQHTTLRINEEETTHYANNN